MLLNLASNKNNSTKQLFTIRPHVEKNAIINLQTKNYSNRD